MKFSLAKDRFGIYFNNGEGTIQRDVREKSMSEHLCHRPNCGKPVPPRLVACASCWYLLPKPLRDEIWRCYVPGQEIRKDPSAEYLRALNACLVWWQENRPLPRKSQAPLFEEPS